MHELIVCRSCVVKHYENCGSCWGFGVYLNGVPVSASNAMDKKLRGTAQACPECKSTPDGLPANGR